MPNRTLSILGYTALSLFGLYVALMGATVYFAALTNEFSQGSRELEKEVAVLETEYYAALEEIAGADVSVLGFVTPSSVDYVAEGGTAALTRASR